jgi:hypothetical protein
MKIAILCTILCLTLVTLCGATARAAEDATEVELQALLAGHTPPPSLPVEDLPIIAAQVREAAAGPAIREREAQATPDANLDKRESWQVESRSATEPDTVSAAGDDAPTPAPINPVPEPSAVILAVAALGYFLLFARRRRV